MKWRRAGNAEAPPVVVRRAIDVSTREGTAPAARLGAIRGLAPLLDARWQTEEAWRETWADELEETK